VVSTTIQFDYSKYYWKNDLIKLRPPVESDWEHWVRCVLDTESRMFF